MNTRRIGFAGLAALGLVLTALGLALAAPAHAFADAGVSAFMLARNEQGSDARQKPRDAGKDEQRSDRREAEREEPQGYGYGYERRQQDQPSPHQAGSNQAGPNQAGPNQTSDEGDKQRQRRR